jgi:hypothetical protein
MQRRVNAMKHGSVNLDTDEITFDLIVETKQDPISFIVSYTSFMQILYGLGKLHATVQRSLREKKSMQAISAEDVAVTHIQKDRWKDVVLLQITNSEGVPYTFAIPPDIAIDMAEQLKTESAKPHQTGHA